MKRFSPQSIFPAIAAFMAVLFFAEASGTSGPGKTAEDLKSEKK